jgi:hypothetical protein
LAGEGRGAAPDRVERRAGPYGPPYVAAVELTAATEAEPEADPKPYPFWIRPLSEYDRREGGEFQMSRYG